MIADTFRGGATIYQIEGFIDELYDEYRESGMERTDTAARKVEKLRQMDWSTEEDSDNSGINLQLACQNVSDEKTDLQEGGAASTLLTCLRQYDTENDISQDILETELSTAVEKLIKYEQLSNATLREGGVDVSGDLADKINHLIQTLEDSERKNKYLENRITTLKEEKRKLEQQAELASLTEQELDTGWLQSQVKSTDPNTRLQEGIRQGYIDNTIIQSAAESVDIAGSVEAQELVDTLENPRNEEDVITTLSSITEKLKEWQQTARQVNDVEKDNLYRRIDTVHEQTSQSSESYDILEELLDICRSDLQSATKKNSVELHSLKSTLDRTERVINNIDTSVEEDQWESISRETNQLRDDLEGLLQSSHLGVSKGHELSRVFVEIGDELTSQARKSAENEEWDVAHAQLKAAERIYEGVKRLYDERELRDLLK